MWIRRCNNQKMNERKKEAKWKRLDKLNLPSWQPDKPLFLELPRRSPSPDVYFLFCPRRFLFFLGLLWAMETQERRQGAEGSIVLSHEGHASHWHLSPSTSSLSLLFLLSPEPAPASCIPTSQLWLLPLSLLIIPSLPHHRAHLWGSIWRPLPPWSPISLVEMILNLVWVTLSNFPQKLTVFTALFFRYFCVNLRALVCEFLWSRQFGYLCPLMPRVVSDPHQQLKTCGLSYNGHKPVSSHWLEFALGSVFLRVVEATVSVMPAKGPHRAMPHPHGDNDMAGGHGTTNFPQQPYGFCCCCF